MKRFLALLIAMAFVASIAVTGIVGCDKPSATTNKGSGSTVKTTASTEMKGETKKDGAEIKPPDGGEKKPDEKKPDEKKPDEKKPEEK